MNCKKSYRGLLNFIISIVILFSGLYFNQTEADAFFDAAKPTAQSTVSGVELPISANTQINTSELLLASRTSYIKEVKQGTCTGRNICPVYRSTARYTGAFFLPLCYFFRANSVENNYQSTEDPMLYPCTGWEKIQLFFSLIKAKRGTMDTHSFLCVLKN